jgi:hypothetical protein
MEFPCYSSVIFFPESFHLQRNVLAYPLIDLLDGGDSGKSEIIL